MDLRKAAPCAGSSAGDQRRARIQPETIIWPRSRAHTPPPAALQAPPGWKLPSHRSRGRAAEPATPITGPGAEGGGGWPMFATAQPWHAEGRPLPTGALRW